MPDTTKAPAKAAAPKAAKPAPEPKPAPEVRVYWDREGDRLYARSGDGPTMVTTISLAQKGQLPWAGRAQDGTKYQDEDQAALVALLGKSKDVVWHVAKHLPPAAATALA